MPVATMRLIRLVGLLSLTMPAAAVSGMQTPSATVVGIDVRVQERPIRQRSEDMFKSLVAEVLGVGSDPVESGASLRDFEWKYRVIAIFEDDDHVQATEQARRFLADPEALRSRDLVLLSVGRDHVRALFGAGDALSAEAIRQDLDVAPGFFGLALIGKDGTVKLLIDRLVEPSDIFERIDQMPMRQNEMSH